MPIRSLSGHDAVAYWNLRLEALRTQPSAFGQTTENHFSTTAEDAAKYLDSLRDGSFALGCFDGETLVGMVRFVREGGAKERHKGSLRSLFVASTHCGQGLGRALTAESLRLAKQDSSLEQILLSVTSSQTAAAGLYRSFGFVKFGTEPRALKIGERYLDEHRMILTLVQPAG